MASLLDSIHGPEDLKSLTAEQLKQLAQELRQAIIDNLSKTGGHFASNLGAVDMIVAMHSVYDVPRDQIVWDVGHQCYAHKMLTGRLGQFPSLRQYGGISGFLRREESPYDIYGAGHASTSISAAYGFAVARDLKGDTGKVVAVIGDAGLTGGLAFEGLNNAGHSGRDFTVVVNDNEMSIAPNVGALSKHLASIRTSRWYDDMQRRTKSALQRLPAGDIATRAASGVLRHGLTNLVAPEQTGLVFEEMGFEYIGPLDGHDLPLLVSVFRQVRQMTRPVLVHLITTKGKGYTQAEDDARKYHAVTPFTPETGQAQSTSGAVSYTGVFGDTLVKLADEDPRVVGITAAMPDGTGLSKLQARYPERFFDVGIAEGHAVCFAAGLAAAGQRPVVAVYSTFLQRAFDMIAHDVALQNLPVVFALDRAGLVGEDGGTHHGAFDLTYLRCIPNLVVCAPKDADELVRMLRFSLEHLDSPLAGPIAVRYPRGNVVDTDWGVRPTDIALGAAEVLRDGSDIALLAIGSMVRPAFEAAAALARDGVEATVINARFAKPLDVPTIVEAARRTGRLLVMEENVVTGGFGAGVVETLHEQGVHDVAVRLCGIPDHFVEHGAPDILRGLCGLTAQHFAVAARKMLAETKPTQAARVRRQVVRPR